MKRPLWSKSKFRSELKFGRWTFFCWWTPHLLVRLVLGRQTFFGQWTPPTSKTSTWQMNLLWPMDPPQIEHRCLEYQYTTFGRWTYFGHWTPQYQSRDALNTSTQHLADEPTLATGPPSTRAEMPWIPVHNTWQMNLLWPSGTRAEMPCIPLQITWQMNLLCPMDPPIPRAEMPWIPVHKTWQMNLLWPLWYQSRDALHTSTQHLADEPTLATGPPSTRAEMPCIPLQITWQMNLLWPMDPPITRAEMPWIPVHNTWQMNLLWPPWYQSRDALHTSTQYLADEHILANGPSHKVTEERCLHTATDILWSRMAISHCYWHLVVQNGNFTLLLTSSGHEWQFHIATDI